MGLTVAIKLLIATEQDTDEWLKNYTAYCNLQLKFNNLLMRSS